MFYYQKQKPAESDIPAGFFRSLTPCRPASRTGVMTDADYYMS
jgi:hypothetical protein